MIESLGIHHEPEILFIIGLIITAAFLGGKAFQRLGIPQVVGFIAMGVLLGTSFLIVVLLPPFKSEQCLQLCTGHVYTRKQHLTDTVCLPFMGQSGSAPTVRHQSGTLQVGV
jgi:hypothetical protein